MPVTFMSMRGTDVNHGCFVNMLRLLSSNSRVEMSEISLYPGGGEVGGRAGGSIHIHSDAV